MGNQIGYIRVSSRDQNTARQLESIKLDKVFTDKISGVIKDRPQLSACIEYLRAGDTLHVHSIDRLARSLRHLQEIIELLIEKGVTVKFHTENLTFDGSDNPMSMLMLQLLGAIAQFERKLSKTRQREGIDAAKLAGKHLGRKPLDYSLHIKAKELYDQRLSISAIARELNLSRASIYKLLS